MDDEALEADLDEGTEEDEPLLWDWRPSGQSCARCEAMAGTYEDDPPAPPHDNCDCEVVLVRPDGRGDDPDECRREMSYEFLSYEGIDVDRGTNVAVMQADFVIHCPDGTDLELSVEVEMDLEIIEGWEPTEEEYALWQELIIAEALEAVEDEAAMECEPCEPRHLV